MFVNLGIPEANSKDDAQSGWSLGSKNVVPTINTNKFCNETLVTNLVQF
jgi:hypothetical protein